MKKGSVSLLINALIIPVLLIPLEGCTNSSKESVSNSSATNNTLQSGIQEIPEPRVDKKSLEIQERNEKMHKARDFLFQDISHYHQIREIVQQVYQETAGKPLLMEYKIEIDSKDRFYQTYQRLSGKRNPNILGFANPKTRVIHVLEGDLGSLLLTILHEVKHVDERPLDNIVAEEAQSYAFELNAIDMMPQIGYGLESQYLLLKFLGSMPTGVNHRRAKETVVKQYKAGKSPRDIYIDITIGKTRF